VSPRRCGWLFWLFRHQHPKAHYTFFLDWLDYREAKR
jgi:hypothetical protein